MIQIKHLPVVTVVLCCAMLFQVSCAGRTKQARFYVLSPVAEAEGTVKKGAVGSRDIAIGISPVALPKYLRKAQIVTRTGSNELHLAEFDRWAGKLEEDISRVIAENLTQLLQTDKVLSYPSMEAIDLDYTIKIDVSRFDGRLGGDIELIARWAVFDKLGNTVYGVKATQIIEPVSGSGYAAMVAAQSRALAAFSRKLAAAINDLRAG